VEKSVVANLDGTGCVQTYVQSNSCEAQMTKPTSFQADIRPLLLRKREQTAGAPSKNTSSVSARRTGGHDVEIGSEC